jgi:hypothetical protein
VFAGGVPGKQQLLWLRVVTVLRRGLFVCVAAQLVWASRLHLVYSLVCCGIDCACVVLLGVATWRDHTNLVPQKLWTVVMMALVASSYRLVKSYLW